MKKDFYIYKCLREIHLLNQNVLLNKGRKGILLILNTPGSLEHFMVHTDPEVIQEVFDRLLSYAADRSQSGTIEFGYKFGKEEHLSFYVKEPGRDTDNLRIFEEEQEAEAELLGEISGLISGLGGKTWVDSNRDNGYTYWFTLEVHPNEKQEEAVEFEKLNPDWSGKTILIVDDVHTNLILLENILGPSNAGVVSVDNGLKAVNAVKKNKNIDFVLMDVRMPVLDGYEATRRIKRLKPWLPVIAISAYPDSAESEKWKLAGCDAYLGKPLNSNKLFRAMENLFQNVESQV